MDIEDLKNIIWKLPDNAKVLYSDPNFPGSYHIEPCLDNFKVEEGRLLIDFPFESPVEF